MGLIQIPTPASGTVRLRNTLTSSGTFTLGSVSNPQTIWVVCVGGGAGGGSGYVHDYTTAVWGGCGAGGPGGAAGGVTINPYIMTGTVSYTIGAGGTGAAATRANPMSSTRLTGNTGGTTNFGELLAYGGWAGNVVSRDYPPQITMFFNDAQSLSSSQMPLNAISDYWNSTIGTRELAQFYEQNAGGGISGYAIQQTFGTSAGGYGGGAGQNFTSGHTAGQGGNGGNGGTGGAVGTASGAGTGWQGSNGAGGTIPIYYAAANPIYSGFAGGGGGGGAGGSANGVAATAGTGGAASTYGGVGGNGGAGGATTGSGSANGSNGSNATGIGAGGGGGGGSATGNTRQGNTLSTTGGAGGNGSAGAIYIFY